MKAPKGDEGGVLPFGLRHGKTLAETAENNRNFRMVAIAGILISCAYAIQNLLAPGTDLGLTQEIVREYLMAFGTMGFLSLAYLAWGFGFGKGKVDRLQAAIHTAFACSLLLTAAFLTAVDLSRRTDYSAIGYVSTGLALAWRCGKRRSIPAFLGAGLACLLFMAVKGIKLQPENVLPVLVAALIALVASFILDNSTRRAFLFQEELREQSSRDPLTGLRNRRYLNETAGLLVASAHRRSMPICVLVFDIDHFKAVNDDRGHLVGDEVLSAVGRLIGSSLRSSDLVVRFGGEEFLAILQDTPLDGGILTAERIRRLVSSLDLPRLGRKITISCGIALLAPGERFEDCVARADAKLYEAKNKGRDRSEY